MLMKQYKKSKITKKKMLIVRVSLVFSVYFILDLSPQSK